MDSVYGRGGVHDSVITVDTAYAEWQGASAAGGGTLGWRAPHEGRMRFDLSADSLIGFDSLLLAVTQQKRDTSAEAKPLNGRAVGRVDLAGSLDSLQADATAEVAGFEWQRYRAPRMSGTLRWLGGRRPRITARASADTIHARQWVLRGTGVAVDGFVDSLAWGAGSALGETTRLDAVGRWYAKEDARMLWVDTASAKLAVSRYRLDRPVMVSLADSAPELSPLVLRALDGSSLVEVEGKVPGKAPGDLRIQVLGLDLHDFYGLLQRDTLGVAGQAELDLQVGGTSAAPTFRGLARLADGRFGDFQSPFVQGVLNYADRRLDANLDLWRTGERLLQVEAHLPLDLALTGAEKRQTDGPLFVRARTDSVSLGLLEAITPAVDRRRRHARGRRAGGGNLGSAPPHGQRQRAAGQHVAARVGRPVRQRVGWRAAARGLDRAEGRACSPAAAASSGWAARCAWSRSRGRCSPSTSAPSSSAPSTSAAS